MKLDTLSLTELKAIEAELPTVIAIKKSAEAERIKDLIAKTAEKHGFSMKDLFGDAKTHRSIAPKYRDPKSGKTWTGRGRAPLWMPKRKGEYENLKI